ncbi:uncharacterized protein CXorf65 homolog isoform X1 [Anas platyrhynchos]|uniref:uncharacterized protein CXorf65 homolog isoform X1 n=1 Tax=Anas platyrhynchos TaxID=8839 RepID=UPI003AF2BAC2
MFICINHGDNQSFLVNTDCPVLLLLSHLRSKVGVPATDVIDVCDKLGTPKLLFQVKTLRERASEFLPAPGTYYVCRVELGTPGTAQELASRTFTPLLKDPSVALIGGGTAAPRAAHAQEAPALAEGCGGQEGAGHRGTARWHLQPGSGQGSGTRRGATQRGAGGGSPQDPAAPGGAAAAAEAALSPIKPRGRRHRDTGTGTAPRGAPRRRGSTSHAPFSFYGRGSLKPRPLSGSGRGQPR